MTSLDGALERLAAADPESARLVELRFFGGFGWDQIAEAMDLSRATVHRRWKTARAWLAVELGGTGRDP